MRVGVDVEVHWHADPDVMDLRLLVVGGDPDVGRPDREHRLARLDAIAGVGLAVLDVSGDLGADLGPSETQPGIVELLLGAGDGGQRHLDGRGRVDDRLKPLAGRLPALGAEEVLEGPGLRGVFRVEADTDLRQARGDLADGRLDGRLLVLQLPGDVERVLVVGGQAELGARLLDGGPGLLLLFGGHLQAVVPLVELGLGGRAALHQVVDPPLVDLREPSDRLSRLERRDLGAERGDLPPQGLLGVLATVVGPPSAGDLRMDLGPRLHDVGPGLLERRLGLRHGHLERLAVELHQELARLDPVVLVDHHLGDEALDPRAGVRDMALDESVVGGDRLEFVPDPGHAPVPPGARDRGDDRADDDPADPVSLGLPGPGEGRVPLGHQPGAAEIGDDLGIDREPHRSMTIAVVPAGPPRAILVAVAVRGGGELDSSLVGRYVVFSHDSPAGSMRTRSGSSTGR